MRPLPAATAARVDASSIRLARALRLCIAAYREARKVIARLSQGQLHHETELEALEHGCVATCNPSRRNASAHIDEAATFGYLRPLPHA